MEVPARAVATQWNTDQRRPWPSVRIRRQLQHAAPEHHCVNVVDEAVVIELREGIVQPEAEKDAALSHAGEAGIAATSAGYAPGPAVHLGNLRDDILALPVIDKEQTQNFARDEAAF